MIIPEPLIYCFLSLFADDNTCTVIMEGHEYQKLIETKNCVNLRNGCNLINTKKPHFMLFHSVRLKQPKHIWLAIGAVNL